MVNLPLLNKATADNDTPTAGYMYQEINKIGFESGSYCQDLLDFLVDRLDKNSCHVKLKVLRIMTFIVKNGHPEFRQRLRKKSTGILQATKFGGPPDPLHGNAPYLMVRKASQELSQLLFDVREDDSHVPIQDKAVLKSIGGMGSVTSDGAYQGFGNTASKSKSLGESLVGGLISLADRIADPAPHKRTTDSTSEKNFGCYKPMTLSSTDTNNFTQSVSQSSGHPSQTRHRQPSPNRKHRRGVAGGGWDDSEEPEQPFSITDHNMSQNTSSADTPSSLSQTNTGTDYVCENGSHKSTDSSGLSERLQSLKTDDWTTEINLVERLLTDNKSPIPRRVEINSFMKECSRLNCDKIIEILGQNLADTQNNSNVIMRCLLLIESFMRTDYVTADSIVEACCPNLISLYKGQPGPIQSKARKILRLLEKLSSHRNLFDAMSTSSPSSDVTHEVILGTPKQAQQPITEQAQRQTALLLDDTLQEADSDFLPLKVPFGTESAMDESLNKQRAEDLS